MGVQLNSMHASSSLPHAGGGVGLGPVAYANIHKSVTYKTRL